jgi:RNA polymerase sigma-70 factor, ECF subfamily
MGTADKVDFHQLYETYQPRIHKYLIRLVGAEEAEDLTQEVFLKASQGLDGFRGEAQMSTWLYRIATNAAIDRACSIPFRQISKEVVLDETCEGDSGEIWSMAKEASLEQILLEKDRIRCFVGYLNRLPLNYKIILLLTEVEEMTTREIAGIMGLSQETVKMRLHRGRERLFRTLKDNCRPEEWL